MLPVERLEWVGRNNKVFSTYEHIVLETFEHGTLRNDQFNSHRVERIPIRID